MNTDIIATIDCEFNLFREGRTYTGNHRSYVLENARNVCESASVAEKIRLREALGYYGHGRRILAKRMDLEEVQMVKAPDGSNILVSNIPSNVTTKFQVLEDGTVRHTQEILTTETGKIVAELHKSRVGGFSWACPGADGGSNRPTRLSGFSGFDYVLNPGFAFNRGYVLESANSDNNIDRGLILESIAKATGMPDSKVEEMVSGWAAQSHIVAADLQEQVEQAAIYERALVDKISQQESNIVDLENIARKADEQLISTQKKVEDAIEGRKQLIDFVVENIPFFIPDDVKHLMLEGDFDKVFPIFESAKRVDLRCLPIGKDAIPAKTSSNNNTKRHEQVGWVV